jgi:flagellar hook-basal body complex protein FliE
LITSEIGNTAFPFLSQNMPLQSPIPSGDGFESVLKSLGTNAVEALRNGESTAIAAIEGKASTQQAVMATMQAEQSLQAALAIRDKIVSAFLEISRMQI